MTREILPPDETHPRWRREPNYLSYDVMADELALADAMTRARIAADMTQEQVAKAMGTTQGVIARLEGGRAMPTTRTLQRFAHATGTRLRIVFEPVATGETA